MIFLKPGGFIMGSTTEHELERPLRTVDVRPGFFMGRTEVTQAQFREVMGSAPWTGKKGVIDDRDAAASYVTWDEAMEFCGRLNERDPARPRGFEYRLPTEAEWEFACRAGTTGTFSCAEGELEKHAVFLNWESEHGYAHRVATRLPNPWGLYDMHGNILEWCLDWYGTYDPGRLVNPVGPNRGEHRVLRGGHWGSTAEGLRSSDRRAEEPGLRDNTFGFRVVLSAIPGR